ncbi:hypothetical protein HMPREF1544_03388 [Mucor circinelloides 1006PhL]|uniref:Polar growth protein n=1 Tax=Mucor circinelloides f. circinelloides (strain 1006PhL) TaxID=1220926 RepID=S2KBM5_MUCC1|nr:hypothetical protein HMPREF1544_03388 [Mucor circinelloides 1006PhL]
MTNMIVYAIHNFEAENEDEINFQVGEPITVLEKDEKYLDGWWQGRNINGETGLFPMNYTSPEKPILQQQSTGTEHFEAEAPQHPTMTSPLPLPQLTSNSYMPSPHLSSRSSGSTIEDEIDDALSQLQSVTMTTTATTPDIIVNDKDTNKVESWDVDQVADWLKSVGLDSVSRNFIDQEISGDILLDLNIDALKELGITTFGKRYKIMQAITSLKEESSVEINKPTPNTSVSTSAISRPASRKSINSLKRSNSQNDSSSDILYQFPRKAPLPPSATSSSKSSDLMRPISPQSLSSSGVSRSNTFNTVSSGGTLKSREMSPDPKGFRSPRRVLSQKSQQTFDSIDKELSHSQISSAHTTTSHTASSIHNNNNSGISNTKNDWMSMSDVASTHSSAANNNNNNATMNVHPLNTPTASLSSSRQPMQISNAHKLSVSSFDDTSNLANRQSTTEAFQAPEHEGWLHKQSDKYKTWNKRWFVLKGSNLFYFKSPKDVRMKGIINLRGYKIIVDETIHAGKYCFKAQHDRERTFFFYTDTEESMRVWLKMLMKTTIARDFRAPVMSSNHIATVSLDVARRMRPRPPSVIMYKNQKQLKINNDPKMSMLEEEEESNFVPVDQQPTSPIPQYRQTRESGITMYQQHGEEEEEEIPQLPSHYPTQQQQQMHHQMMLKDEEEDLIDPQHRSLPLSSSLSVTSSISNSNSGDEWSSEQYINWINAYLPAGKKAIDLTSAFRNGDTLIQLLEAISHKEVRRPPIQKGGSMSVMMLDNIVAAFKFMGREGVEVDGRYTIKDVFGGNEEKIITMLDAIKTWADHTYPMNTTAIKNDMMSPPPTKKSDTSVLIGKDSGWRGSAMMDNRHTFSDDGF